MKDDAAPIARRRRFVGRVLPRAFYDRDAAVVARALLGMILEHRTADGAASGRIVETEAYLGEDDLASHAAAGRTERTDPMFGPPGTAYVYLIYGMHWCVNAVTREEGHASAVLIRAVEPLEGEALMRRRRPRARRSIDFTNGPAKLCQALAIDGRLNRHDLRRPPLVIRHGEDVPEAGVIVSPRIGITRSTDLPLRWFVAGSPYVSRTPPHFPTRPLAS